MAQARRDVAGGARALTVPNTRRVLILAVLMWTVGSTLARTTNDPYDAAPSTASRPVLLRLNYSYLLFTYPVAPYRDENGSIMVPLRVVGELMGGQVYTRTARKAGLLIRPTQEENHLLEFIAGSRKAFVDEKPVQLESTPVWLSRERELLVPLEPMIAAFDLRPRWNRQKSVLTLSSSFFEYFESFELETLPGGYEETERLVPDDVTLTRRGPSRRQLRLDMNLRNVSGTPVRAGQQGVVLWAQYGGVAGAVVRGRDTYVPTIDPAPADPCRKEAGRSGFVCRAVFPAFYSAISGLVSGSYPVDYLIARVRVRLPPDGQ